MELPKRADALWAGRIVRPLECTQMCIESGVPHALEVLDHDMSLSPLLFVGTSDGCVSVRSCLDLHTVVAVYPHLHEGSVSCIQHVCTANLDAVITAGLDGKICSIDSSSLGDRKKPPKILFVQKFGVIDMDFSMNMHVLFTCDFSQTVRLWEIVRL